MDILQAARTTWKERLFCRILCLWLISSLLLPAPLAGASGTSFPHPSSARVQARLNSPERAEAIAKMHAQYNESTGGEGGEVIPRPSPFAFSPFFLPQNNGNKSTQIPSASRYSSGLARPKSLSEVLFNTATSMMGVPGLTHSGYDPYSPNADQGLGFHADGTVRRAGGEDSNYRFDGSRAQSYARAGLGYGNQNHSLYGTSTVEPAFDPITGESYRFMNPTSGGRRSANAGGFTGMNANDPNRMALDRGLSYSLGLVNTAAESLFMGVLQSPYGGARARFNFMADWNGKVNGEGDVLLPLYDSTYTTVFTQLGARSMAVDKAKDRWIGNFGVGQRWYPLAVNRGIGEDAGTFMFGYNAFYDHDFTRSHQRGGLGLEVQYDWLHLASNYYAPLSSWKDSVDFDSRFVQERPAEGWDIRGKAYLPFYRNVAVTGGYTQWFGDYVGMFGPSKLERDPKVWNYGLEYTPIPLVSGFLQQRATERGKTDTEFGLRFTYHFGQSWQDQISHSKVAELRTVGGSRHEFVDRENRIVLEYRGKNSYYLEFLGMDGPNLFRFRVVNGFGQFAPGYTVGVSINNGATIMQVASAAPTTFFARVGTFIEALCSMRAAHAASSRITCLTNTIGQFVVQVDDITVLPVVLTADIGTSQQVVVLDGATITTGLTPPASNTTNGASSTLTFTGPANTTVDWAIVSGPGTLTSAAQTTTDASGRTTATILADATGAGTITVKATVAGVEYTATITIPNLYTLEALPGNPIVREGETRTLRFVLKQNGAPVANTNGIPVAITGPGSISPTTVSTDGNGEFTLDVTGTGTGTATITATVPGSGARVQVPIAGPAVLVITRVDNQILQVWRTTTNVEFALTDGGVALPIGTPVTLSFTSSPGAFTSPPATATADASGHITITLTGQTAGAVTMTATAGTKTATINLTVDAPPPAGITPAISNTTNGATTLLTFNGPPSTAVVWSILSGPGSLNSQQNTTNGAGVATTNVLANATGAGTITVQAAVAGVNYTATITIPSVFTLEAEPTNPALRAGETKTLTFILKENGVIVPNKSISGATASGGASVSGTPPPSTDVNGKFSLNLTGTAQGTATVSVTVNGTPVSVSVPVGAATVLAITREDTQPLVVDMTTTNVQFRLTDDAIALADGTSVTLAFAPANAFTVASVTASVSGGNGVITIPNLRGKTAGTVTVTATVGSKTATVDAAVEVARMLTPNSASIQNGNNTTFIFHGAPGLNVTWTLSTGSFTLGTVQNTTDGSGYATAIVNANATGFDSATVTATVQGQPYTATVNMIESYTLVPTPGNPDVHVGEDSTLEFTLLRNGVPVTNASGLAINATGNGSIAVTTVDTDASGKFSLVVTGTTAGTVNLVVTVNGGSATASVPVTVLVVTFSITSVTNGGDFQSAKSATASATATLALGGTGVNNAEVTWELVSSETTTTNDYLVVVPGRKAANTYYGMSWGSTVSGTPENQLSGNTSSTTSAVGQASVQLTDVMGERKVRLKASVTHNSVLYTDEKDITFGQGPLSLFRFPDTATDLGSKSFASTFTFGMGTRFYAAEACGGTIAKPVTVGVQADSNLPDPSLVSNAIPYASSAAGWTIVGGVLWTNTIINTVNRVTLVDHSGAIVEGTLILNTSSVLCTRP